MTTHALHTDVQQLAMLAAYFAEGTHGRRAMCEMFVRKLPPNRRFLVAAGLANVLAYLEGLRFTDAQIEAMREVPELRRALSHDLVEYLRAFRFTGDVYAVPEGTVVFESEPFLRVEGTLAEAQLVETFVLSTLNFQTQIASKAARIVLAADGRPVVELGARRVQADAAVDVARAAYIAGFAGTSNAEAFFRYEVPARGTMAHMYVMANDDERKAFAAWAGLYERATYLVDTYDTGEGVDAALDAAGARVAGVRIDSGDLAALSRTVRAQLVARGRRDVQIFVSSDLDEYSLTALVARGDFDAAGVGTRLATCDDAPSLGGVYKLVQIDDRGVAKHSPGKVTYPGPHQVYRHERDGKFAFDTLGLVKELSYGFVEATPLLVPVMREGRVTHRETIHDMRARCRAQLAMLPSEVSAIAASSTDDQTCYRVTASEALTKKLDEVRAAHDEKRAHAVGDA